MAGVIVVVMYEFCDYVGSRVLALSSRSRGSLQRMGTRCNDAQVKKKKKEEGPIKI